MNESTSFSLEIKDGVAWLTLCRPERRNAMGMAFFRELTDHFRRFDKDDAVRAVVIRADGPTFTAGLDLMEAGGLLTGKGADDREKLKETILELQESNNAIERCRKPVIAAPRAVPTIAASEMGVLKTLLRPKISYNPTVA